MFYQERYLISPGAIMQMWNHKKELQHFLKGVRILIVYNVLITITNAMTTTSTISGLLHNCRNNIKVYDMVRKPNTFIVEKNETTYRIFLSLTSDYLDKHHTISTYDLFFFHAAVPYEYSAAGITLAWEEFCLQGWLPDIQVEIIYMDDGCDPRHGIPNIIQMQQAGVDVIIGMPCSLITLPAGYYLSYWEIPLITYASNDPLITDKDLYDTVIRIGEGYKALGNAFLEIFNTFGWKTTAIISVKSGLCHYGSNYIPDVFSKNNLNVAEFDEFIDGKNISDHDMDKHMRHLKQRARVYIICLDGDQLVHFMMSAKRLGMISNEFVFFTFDILPSRHTLEPWGTEYDQSNLELLNYIKSLFQYMKIVTVEDVRKVDKAQELMNSIQTRMKDDPWNINVTDPMGYGNSPYGLYLYDSMWFYLSAINQSMNEGLDPRNGTNIVNKAKNSNFEGSSGHVVMDDVADRVSNYWVWQMNLSSGRFEHFAIIDMVTEQERMTILHTPLWNTEDGQPPLDEPKCGFLENLCPPNNTVRDSILISLFAVLFVSLMIIFPIALIIRKKKFEEAIQKMAWKIEYEELEFTQAQVSAMFRSTSAYSQSDLKIQDNTKSVSNNSDTLGIGQNSKVAFYKGMKCAVRMIDKSTMELDRDTMLTLKKLKDLNHDNINNFIGACLVEPNFCVITQYCAKGALQDILQQDEIKLDWMFKCSLISDLTKGIAYIHDSPIMSHGHLKSSCCMIDSRWVLKITSVGVYSLKQGEHYQQDMGDYEKHRNELWTAPELLRMDPTLRPVNGTQKGDVYSYSIILQEILYRALPFFLDEHRPEEIIQKVREPSYNSTPYRPSIYNLEDVDPNMLDLMEECWEEEAKLRPDFHTIKKKLVSINKGKKIDIMDNILHKLEAYANNLEAIVDKRTSELTNEKRKTDILLYRMLPPLVAEKLKLGQNVVPEVYENVTIYFSDIVGFTEISSDSTPMEVVDFLNDLYTAFDDILIKYDVYKVETIGDAYMVVSGLPKRNANRHASEIADMALELCANCRKFKIRHLPWRQMEIRVGLHTGSCAAGVVGLTMPRYCLFGDTVNVASRMESNGEAMKIHVSETVEEILKPMNKYILTLRGVITVKGKGEVNTYWLEGKRPTGLSV